MFLHLRHLNKNYNFFPTTIQNYKSEIQNTKYESINNRVGPTPLAIWHAYLYLSSMTVNYLSLLAIAPHGWQWHLGKIELVIAPNG